ncbi:MAG: biofilm PGA synthesis N-glycosyltransferase PgaC, partial [Bacteroidia bacterium]
MIWGVLILCGLAIAKYVRLIIGYTNSWATLPVDGLSIDFHPSTSVTVIVPARNEAKGINACLDGILHQKYPNDLLTIVVIDDHSEDETFNLCNELSNTNSILKVISLTEDEQGKKAAITKAIDSTDSELIITTDADCKHGENWIRTLVSIYEQEKPSMILAPVVFHKEQTWLNRILRLEFLALMGSSGASAQQNLPTMCNGANLCYTREAFKAVNGFDGIADNPSGDDVFLMLKIHDQKPGSVRFTKSIETIVATDAPSSLSAFWQQRKRWLSKKSGYSHPHVKNAAYAVFFGNMALIGSIWISTQLAGFRPIWGMGILMVAAK